MAGKWGQEALLKQLVGVGCRQTGRGGRNQGDVRLSPQPLGQEGWGSHAPAGPILHPLQMDRPRGLRPLPAACMTCTGSMGSTRET